MPSLTERLRARHENVLSDFLDGCRQRDAAADAEVAQLLRGLQDALAASRAESAARLQDAVASNETELRRVEEAEAQLQQPECTVLTPHTDAAHPEGATLDGRGDRIRAARIAVHDVTVLLVEQHRGRMALIAAVADQLASLGQQRQAAFAGHARDLLLALATVSYVSVSEAQALVQRATLASNAAALAAQHDAEALITGVRQHELLTHRGRVVAAAALLRETAARCERSVVAWTLATLRSAPIRDPPARAALLQSVRGLLARTNDDLSHVTRAIRAAVESLVRHARGGGASRVPLSAVAAIPVPLPEDQMPCDTPGGTGDGGWLRSFRLDDPVALPPFTRTAADVSEEWGAAYDTVLSHLAAGANGAMADAAAGAAALEAHLNAVCDAMASDVRAAHTPTYEEMQLRAACGDVSFLLPPADAGDDASAGGVFDSAGEGEVPRCEYFPFVNQLTSNDSAIAVALGAVQPVIEGLRAEIANETRWFGDALSLSLLRAMDVASARVYNRGLRPLARDATALLFDVAATVSRGLRETVLGHERTRRDHIDALQRLEAAYQVAEDRVARSGSLEGATAACAAAAAVLGKIEEEYKAYCDKRVATLPAFLSTVEATMDSLQSRIQSALCVTPAEHADREWRERQDDEQQRRIEAEQPPAKGKNVVAASAASKKSAAAAAAAASKVDPSLLAVAQQVTQAAAQRDPRPRVRTMRGTAYVCIGGAADIVELGGIAEGERLRNAPVATPAPEPTIDPKAAKKKEKEPKPPKLSKAQMAEMERLEAEAAEREAAAKAAKQLRLVESTFMDNLRDALAPIFHDACIIDAAELSRVVLPLRTFVLDWFDDLRARCSDAAAEFARATRTEVEEETHECLRRHARRPVALRTHVYERRIRELQEAAAQRADMFGAWHRRAVETADNARAGLERAAEAALELIQQLSNVRAGLGAAMQPAQLQAHGRTYSTRTSAADAEQRQALAAVQARALAAISVVRGEVEAHRRDRMHLVEHGGTLTPEEHAKCVDAVRALLETMDATVAEVEGAVANANTAWAAQLAAEGAAYTAAAQRSEREVAFLQRLGELLSKARGAVSNRIAESEAAQARLRSLVEQLEAVAASSGAAVAPDIPARPQVPPALAPVDVILRVPAGAPSPPTPPTTAAIAGQLQRDRAVRDAVLLTSSRPARIVAILEQLRSAALIRGLELGALAFMPEWTSEMNAKENPLRLESIQERAEAAAAAAAKEAAAAASKDKKGAAAKKGATALQKGAAAAPPTDSAESLYAGPTAQRLEWLVAMSLAAHAADMDALIAATFSASGAPQQLVRADAYGADAAAIRSDVARRVREQKLRFANHIKEHAVEYRALVHRVQVAIHGGVSDLFSSLWATSAANASGTLSVMLAAFGLHNASLRSRRDAAAKSLRAPLGAAGNAAARKTLLAAEAARQIESSAFLATAHGAALRELQHGAEATALRAGEMLKAMFAVARSMVTPAHLAPADDAPEVGAHRGLRRLLRLKQREDAGGAQTAATPAVGGPRPPSSGQTGTPQPPVRPSASTAAAASPRAGRLAKDAATAEPAPAAPAVDPIPQPPVLVRGADTFMLGIAVDACRCYTRHAVARGWASERPLLAAEEASAAAALNTSAKGNAAGAAPPSRKGATATAFAGSPTKPTGRVAAADAIDTSTAASTASPPPVSWEGETQAAIAAFVAAAREAAIRAAEAEALGVNAATAVGDKKGAKTGAAGSATAAAKLQQQQLVLLASAAAPVDPETVVARLPAVPVPGGLSTTEARFYPVAYAAAQNAVAAYNRAVDAAREGLDAAMEQLRREEERWAATWDEAARNLHAGF